MTADPFGPQPAVDYPRCANCDHPESFHVANPTHRWQHPTACLACTDCNSYERTP